jgi:hypothetical protein
MYLLGIGVTPGIYAFEVERLEHASSCRNLAEIEYCWLMIGPPGLFLRAAAECDPMGQATISAAGSAENTRIRRGRNRQGPRPCLRLRQAQSRDPNMLFLDEEMKK